MSCCDVAFNNFKNNTGCVVAVESGGHRLKTHLPGKLYHYKYIEMLYLILHRVAIAGLVK
jgi:hypothetical protein